MKFTLLGTGTSQGVPVIGCRCEVCTSSNPKDQRLRCSVLIETETTTVIIDAGPDFRQQCLRANVKKLDAVVFTHEHRDHSAGLDDIRPFNFKQNKDMEVYCTEQVEQSLKQQYEYIFADLTYPGIPKVMIRTISDEVFTIGDIEFTPIQVMHYKLPVLGFRIGDFTYITDANFISPEERAKASNSKLLVLNALHHKPHISHFNLEEARAVAKGIRAEQTYFTHISHYMGLHDTINNTLPNDTKLAFDGLQLKL